MASTESEAKVIFRSEGEARVERATKGLTRTTKNAQKEIRQENTKTVREEERNLDRILRKQLTVQRAILAAVKNSERQQREEMKQTTREAERQYQIRNQAARSAARMMRGMVAGGAAAGAYAFSRGNAVAGALGVTQGDQRIAEQLDFRRQTIRMGRQRQMSGGQIRDVQNQIINAAEYGNGDPMQLTQALRSAQGRFGDFTRFMGVLPQISQISHTTGASPMDILNTLGSAQAASAAQGVEFSDADSERFLSALVAKANTGSIEFAELANVAASGFGKFARATGQGGVENSLRYVDLLELAGSGQAGAAQTATQVSRALDSAINADTLEKARSAGVNTEGVNGDIGVLAQRLNDADISQAQMQTIFGNIRAIEGISVIRGQLAGEGTQLSRDLVGADANAGRLFTADTFSMLNEGALGEAAGLKADAFRAFHENGEEYVATMVGLAARSSQLTNTYPDLIEATKAATVVMAGFAMAGGMRGVTGMAGAGGRLMNAGLGRVAAGGGAMAGAAGVGVTAVGAASGLAIAGTVGLGAVLGGAAGLAIREAFDTDEVIDNFLRNTMGIGPQIEERATRRGSGDPADGITATDEEMAPHRRALAERQQARLREQIRAEGGEAPNRVSLDREGTRLLAQALSRAIAENANAEGN